MSSAPSETTCGTPAPAGRLQPVRPGREHAADQVVGELRRREVEDAGDEAGLDQASMLRPPVPVAWKTSTS